MTESVKLVEKWLDEHGDSLFRYALSLVRDRSVAEDLVQETFIVALRSAHKFEGRSSPRTWLSGILRHKALDYHRRSFREEKSQVLEEPEQLSANMFDESGHWKKDALGDWPTDPHEVLRSGEFRSVLEECLSKLDSRKRAAITLRAFEDLSTEEICKELDITATNFWVLAHRGRETLRRCLEKNWFGKT